MKKLFYVLLLFITLSVICSAQNAPEDLFVEAGVSAGAWLGFPSPVWTNYGEYEKETSFLTRVYMGVYLHKNFFLGSFLNYCPSYELNGSSTDVEMLEWGATFAPRMLINDNTTVKLGFEIGNRYNWGSKQYNAVDGVGVNFSLEVQSHRPSGLILYANPGFLSQPVGSEYSWGTYWFMEYAPIFYVNFGVATGVSKNRFKD